MNLLSKQQFDNDTLPEKHAPLHMVPLLHVLPDDVFLTQSLAIVEYLEEAHPEARPLLPPASRCVDRAVARALACHVESGVQPFQVSAVFCSSFFFFWFFF